MTDVSKRLEKASRYLQKGGVAAALDEYLRVLEEEPQHEAASLAAAELQIQLGRRSEALAVLTRLLEAQLAHGNPGASHTWKKLSRLARPAPELSLRLAQQVQKDDPKLALESGAMAAPALLQAGRKPEALAAYQLLAALEPNREHVRRLAEITAELGDRREAASRYLQLAALDPAPNHTLECFRHAHRLDPASSEAAIGYARAAFAAGDLSSVIEALESVIEREPCPEDVRLMFGEALLARGQAAKAAPFLMEAVERNPRRTDALAAALRAMLSAGQDVAAIEIAKRFESALFHADQRRECMQVLRQMVEIRPPRLAFLEHLAVVFNTSSYEQDYSATLLQLFELHFAAGDFLKAADCLERAVEVDSYEPGHNHRLEMLRGKIPARIFNGIGQRFGLVQAGEEPVTAAMPEEATVLEDLVLQAEFFLRYKLPTRALERLDRVRKLFPGEEANNPRLRELYLQMGITPMMPPAPSSSTTGEMAPQRMGFAPPVRPPASVPAPMMSAQTVPAPIPAAVPVISKSWSEAPSPVAPSPELHHLTRVNEIARNLQRQGTVKAVLFTAVNDIGRHWRTGRCIALMATPGKPPSIALEYCSPGRKQSDIKDIIKLLGMLQPLVIAHGPLAIPDPGAARAHGPLRKFAADIGVKSLLTIPLLEGDQHAGLLILADCDHGREWSPADTTLLKTLCDQMSLSVSNARLRGQVRDLSFTEEKSGLLKRSAYLDVLLAEVRRSQAQRSPCCVLMLDLTNDYEVARAAGESKGEALMQHIGQIVSSHIRRNDLALRYDTATIALILTDTTEQSGVSAGEELRRVLASVPLPGSNTAPRATTAVAEPVIEPGYDPVDVVTELINRAEEALAVARATGPTTYALPSPWKSTPPPIR